MPTVSMSDQSQQDLSLLLSPPSNRLGPGDSLAIGMALGSRRGFWSFGDRRDGASASMDTTPERSRNRNQAHTDGVILHPGLHMEDSFLGNDFQSSESELFPPEETIYPSDPLPSPPHSVMSSSRIRSFTPAEPVLTTLVDPSPTLDDRITVPEGNAKSTTRRVEQEEILRKVNTQLRKLIYPWRRLCKAAESCRLIEGDSAEGLEEMVVVTKRIWVEVLCRADTALLDLSSHRSKSSSGRPWHQGKGLFEDLPLSWFQRHRSLLCPDRLAVLSIKALTHAIETIDILESMLDKAAETHQTGSRSAFKPLAVDDFVEELGIDLKWRRKLGSLDVVQL